MCSSVVHLSLRRVSVTRLFRFLCGQLGRSAPPPLPASVGLLPLPLLQSLSLHPLRERFDAHQNDADRWSSECEEDDERKEKWEEEEEKEEKVECRERGREEK